MSELLTKMFFGGFVRMHVLYHAVKEPIFGVEMMEELARHGYDVGAGTLYPMLHQLEEAGYLSRAHRSRGRQAAEVLPGHARGGQGPGGGQGEAARAGQGSPPRQTAHTVNPVERQGGRAARR